MPQAAGSSNTGPIREITVDGFQSLVGVTIPLSPGLNVVVGESDVGKSAVIRALQGLVGNSRGDGFINVRTGRCAVSVSVTAGEDGEAATVLWRKPENSYQIDDDEPFRKVGAAVPQQVLDLLNMAPLELDQNSTRSINIVEQSGPKFLVEDKETDVAKTVGAITRLQPVYNAMRLAAADRRAAAGGAKALAAEASLCRLKLAVFADLESEAERLGRAKAALARCAEAHGRLGELRGLAARLRGNAAETAGVAASLAAASATLSAGEHVKLATASWKAGLRLRCARDALRSAVAAAAALARRAAAIRPAAGLRLSELEASGILVAALLAARGGLAGNAAARAELAAKLAPLSATVGLNPEKIGLDADELDRMDGLRRRLAACDAALSGLSAELEVAGTRLNETAARVAGFLETASVCPLSGGRLFRECKELIGREQ
jgi:exonuclease SbcC